MIKNILWDFDGVIIDSIKIKGNGFKELFKDFPQNYQNEIYDYHIKHGGVSRFEKIRYFYEKILCQSITKEQILYLAERFGEIVSNKLLDTDNLIQDSLSFIKENYRSYNFHIVSGAENKELNFICEELKLKKFFLTIEGSPVKKSILIQNLLMKNSYMKSETILIGDAFTDYYAAEENDISFYGYNNAELKKFNYINTFKGIKFE